MPDIPLLNPAIDDLRNRLVHSALDFMEKAIQEIDEQPKMSLVHFATSVELFLKARLMHANWTFVVEGEQKPSAEDFIAGIFKSVAIEEALKRLRVNLGEHFNCEEKKALKDLANHRNRAIHFVNQDIDSTDVRAEQMKCWYILHQLLKQRWWHYFSEMAQWRIERVAGDMLKQRDYLKKRFSIAEPDLDDARQEGLCVMECPACGFMSLVVEESILDQNTYDRRCRVCCHAEWAVRKQDGSFSEITRREGHCFECDSLDSLVWLKDGGYYCIRRQHAVPTKKVGSCQHCGALCAYLPQGKEGEGDVSAWLRCPECGGQQNED